VSPLSPPVVVKDNGYGILTRKRGEILSVVVEELERERDWEDVRMSAYVREPMDLGVYVREPVPGQSEGLTAPLELEGRLPTPLVEAPLAVTPRPRSRDGYGRKVEDYGFS
jgi:hypothetical protein